MLKKLLSGILILTLCLSVFAGCSQKTSFGIDPNKYYIGEVSGEKIPSDLYQYMLNFKVLDLSSQYLKSIMQSGQNIDPNKMPLSELLIKTCLELSYNNQTYKDMILKDLSDNENRNAKIKYLFDLNNLTIDDKEINALYESSKTSDNIPYSSPQFLKLFKTDDKTIKRGLWYDIAYNKLYDFYYGENGVNKDSLTPDEIISEYKKQTALVKHILFKTIDSQYQPVSNSEKEKQKTLANEVLKQLQNGGNFDELQKKYNQDEGSLSNPEGYFLDPATRNSYDQDFANESFKMEIGTYSLVETQFGYHIMYKVDPTKYSGYEQDTAEKIVFKSEFSKLFEEKTKDVTIKFNEETLKLLDPLNLKFVDLYKYNDLKDQFKKNK